MSTQLAQDQDHRALMDRRVWLRLRAAYMRRHADSFPTIVPGTIYAARYDGTTWAHAELVERADQKFARHASIWEKSACVPLQRNRKMPVVDAGNAVVGYLASYRGDNLWVPWDHAEGEDDGLFLGLAQAEPRSVYDGSVPVTMAIERPSQELSRLATCDDSYFALLDLNGNILSLLGHESNPGAVSVGLGPIEYISIGKIGVSVLKTLSKKLTIKATSQGIKMLFLRGAKRLLPKPTAAQARLLRTQVNLRNVPVQRKVIKLKRPTVFRHSITADVQWLSFGGIRKGGFLNLSKRGQTAQYGEGVYAWKAGQRSVGKYIDIEVDATVAVEKLVMKKDGSFWYRLVPAQGDKLPVKIVGHNFTKEEVDMAVRMLGD